MRILKYFLEHKELENLSWIVIADDDTLLSVPRLYRFLNCVPKNIRAIIGERYGYGFSSNG
jgi:UDP-glucose:O-linked fucose beta-1,3-glucosyltransferase